MLNILISILALFMLFSIFRIIIGPTIWDRLLGLNLLSSKITMMIVLFALFMNKSYLLDIALSYGLLNIIGLIFISRFIQGKGKI